MRSPSEIFAPSISVTWVILTNKTPHVNMVAMTDAPTGARYQVLEEENRRDLSPTDGAADVIWTISTKESLLTIPALFTKAFRIAYYPFCRFYARLFVKNRPADPMLAWMCRIAFWTVYGYWPNLIHPRRFAEQLWSRMLYDRNPLLTLISDKYLVRDYVAKKVGPDYLIPLLWKGDNPEAIPYNDLPNRFVIKTNHGCGFNILVPDKGKADRCGIERRLKKWLSVNYAQDTFLGIAWGYKNIKPLVLIEEFLGDSRRPPVDFKFYCFAGRAEFVTVHLDRYGEKKSATFDRDYERLRFRAGFKQYPIEHEKPPNFGSMLHLAERLSEGFNFIRIDLYSLENRIYFGELTPYPVGVSRFTSFDIRDLDLTLGAKWGDNPDWS